MIWVNVYKKTLEIAQDLVIPMNILLYNYINNHNVTYCAINCVYYIIPMHTMTNISRISFSVC